MIGSALSISMYNNKASRAFCFAAGLVAAKPFSTIGTIVCERVLPRCDQNRRVLYETMLTYLVQPWVPAICRNEHKAPSASCCAATLESPTAAFHSPESFINSRTVGSCSDCAESKCFPAASYPSFRTFQFLCAKRSGSGRALKSSSASAMFRGVRRSWVSLFGCGVVCVDALCLFVLLRCALLTGWTTSTRDVTKHKCALALLEGETMVRETGNTTLCTRLKIIVSSVRNVFACLH